MFVQSLLNVSHDWRKVNTNLSKTRSLNDYGPAHGHLLLKPWNHEETFNATKRNAMQESTKSRSQNQQDSRSCDSVSKIPLSSVDEIDRFSIEGKRELNDTHYEEYHDLTDLPSLSQESIIGCLKCRYATDLIYTKMKNHLISINPGRSIPQMFSDEKMEKLDRTDAHIFNIGHNILNNISRSISASECVVISGESGSGKTECCRYLLKFIINRNIQSHPSSNEKTEEIQKRLLQAGPVLEAFGNAPTCHNRNSSRFGKFIELFYNPLDGTLVGGRIQVYLLEKTRILHLKSDKTSSFHVFSAMSTMDVECKTSYLEKDYSTSDEQPFVQWSDLVKSMITLGTCLDDINRVSAVLGSLLMMSRLKFVVSNNSTNGLSHNESITPDGPLCQWRLKRISELLGTSQQHLVTCLTQHKFSSRRESVYIRPCTMDETQARIDTLLKLMYQLLFEWIILQANKCIGAISEYSFKNSSKDLSSVGLLDMYGFECLKTNTLEQLCINYANEKLQQYFVQFLLLATKHEYDEEEVPFCVDLSALSEGQQVTAFLEQHMFPILEEESRMQRKGINATRLGSRLQSEVRHKFSDVITRLSTSDRTTVDLCVRHYAGLVTYDMTDFLEQNADRVPADVFNLLTESGVGRWLLSHQPVQSTSAFVNSHKRRPAVCTQFRGAVSELVCRLNSSTGVHFVRCMKPSSDVGLSENTGFRPPFDVELVLQQLHSSGVLDTVRVCRAAIHPVRMTYDEFHQRYQCLFSSLSRTQMPIATSGNCQVDSPSVYTDLEKCFRKQHRLPSTPPRSSSRSIRRRTGASEVDHQRRVCAAITHVCLSPSNNVLADQFGRNKLFLTQNQSDELEESLSKLRNLAACKIQSYVRYWLHRQRFLRLKGASVRIQRHVRRWILERRRKYNVQQLPTNEIATINNSSETIENESSRPTLALISTVYLPSFPSFSGNSPVHTNENEGVFTEMKFFKQSGMVSSRYIPKPEVMHELKQRDSRCHRLLPYSNLRPFYNGFPVMSGYRLSISNCL